ncbi:MAG: hypothetical protein QOI36_4411 [Pseudonocardiales bacterium]|jgi:hypothetical protein|nr:hypothetical protein [Pseudonocardiales bacterium]
MKLRPTTLSTIRIVRGSGLGARWCWLRPDRGAVEALSPDKVIVLPDVFENHRSADYLEFVQLA